MPKIRPLPSKPRPQRERVAVSLTLPREVLRRIDAICDQEQRPRSQIMEWAAIQYAESHREKVAA